MPADVHVAMSENTDFGPLGVLAAPLAAAQVAANEPALDALGRSTIQHRISQLNQQADRRPWVDVDVFHLLETGLDQLIQLATLRARAHLAATAVPLAVTIGTGEFCAMSALLCTGAAASSATRVAPFDAYAVLRFAFEERDLMHVLVHLPGWPAGVPCWTTKQSLLQVPAGAGLRVWNAMPSEPLDLWVRTESWLAARVAHIHQPSTLAPPTVRHEPPND